MAITGINHITLCTRDLSRAIDFYQTALGAELCAQSDHSVYFLLGSLWVCLEHSTTRTRPSDDSHIAFSCDQEAFEALAIRIQKHARLWKDNVSEGESLYFLDPDDHKLELHVGTLRDRLSHYAGRKDAPMQVIKAP